MRPRPADGDFADAALVFVGTGCPGADAAWHAVAKAEGAAVVNVVDQPRALRRLYPGDRRP